MRANEVQKLVKNAPATAKVDGKTNLKSVDLTSSGFFLCQRFMSCSKRIYLSKFYLFAMPVTFSDCTIIDRRKVVSIPSYAYIDEMDA